METGTNPAKTQAVDQMAPFRLLGVSVLKTKAEYGVRKCLLEILK